MPWALLAKAQSIGLSEVPGALTHQMLGFAATVRPCLSTTRGHYSLKSYTGLFLTYNILLVSGVRRNDMMFVYISILFTLRSQEIQLTVTIFFLVMMKICFS